jgi:hypothetical protein
MVEVGMVMRDKGKVQKINFSVIVDWSERAMGKERKVRASVRARGGGGGGWRERE